MVTSPYPIKVSLSIPSSGKSPHASSKADLNIAFMFLSCGSHSMNHL